jgi:hypothetical protein
MIEDFVHMHSTFEFIIIIIKIIKTIMIIVIIVIIIIFIYRLSHSFSLHFNRYHFSFIIIIHYMLLNTLKIFNYLNLCIYYHRWRTLGGFNKVSYRHIRKGFLLYIRLLLLLSLRLL